MCLVDYSMMTLGHSHVRVSPAFGSQPPTIRLVGMHEFNQIEHDNKVDAWEGGTHHVDYTKPLESHARLTDKSCSRKAFNCNNLGLWNTEMGSLFHVWPERFVTPGTLVVPKDSDLRSVLAEDARTLKIPRKSRHAFICGGWDMHPDEFDTTAHPKTNSALKPSPSPPLWDIKHILSTLPKPFADDLRKVWGTLDNGTTLPVSWQEEAGIRKNQVLESGVVFDTLHRVLQGAGVKNVSTIWGRRTPSDSFNSVGSNVILLPRQNEVILWHDHKDGEVLSLERLKQVVNRIRIATGHRLVTTEGTLKGPFRFLRQNRPAGKSTERQTPKQPRFHRSY
jgi:hypothetical protein